MANLRRILLSILVIACVSCNAPLFRSHEERYELDLELIAELEPYLSDWVKLPAYKTQEERIRIADASDQILSIRIGYFQTASHEEVQVVNIILEVWGDWTKGIIYTEEASQLQAPPDWQWEAYDDGYYVYNYNH